MTTGRMSGAEGCGTIRGLLDARAAHDPDGVCLLEPGGRALDARALVASARASSAALGRLGIAPGESVAFALGNGLEAAQAVLGIQYGGRRALAVNLVAGTDIMGHALGHGRARAVLTTQALRPQVEAALGAATFEAACDSGTSAVLDVAEVLAGEADVEPARPAAGDDALLMYTSGTTGRPKGVRLTHANLLAGGRNVAAGHGLEPRDRALCTLPLYHINGLCVTLYGPLVSGGSTVLPERFSASGFWGQVTGSRCTWASLVPTQVAYLLHGAGARDAADALRFVRSASAPLAPDVHRAFEARFGLPLIETMGLTETAAQIATNPMPPAARRVGSPGRATGCELRVAGSPHAEGEILVRGPNVMAGYFRDAAATAAALDADGWLRTGDLGRLDGDGFLWVTGRLKELIIRGGENIAPREIDEALLAHPHVLEAAAFGRACADYGERVEAAVVRVPGTHVEEATLLAACEATLGAFRCPERVHFLDELPKGPSGKIQRLRCAELCAAADAPRPVR